MRPTSFPAFELDFQDPRSHRLGVALQVLPHAPVLRLSLPSWTPGSYLLRDYVGQLEGLEVVQAGRCLEARRLGLRCEIDTKYELGLVYEFALTDKDDDIMDKRLTFDFAVRF